VYTDLDGTLLGRRGSLFADGEGNFSLLQARGIEACHRVGAEIVPKSGRREPQVMELARLMGQSSYIFEAGCAMVIDGERTLFTGEMEPEGEVTVAEQITIAGVPELLFKAYPERIEFHSPWHRGREYSHLFRGKIEVSEANSLLAEAGHEHLRLLDNGAIGRPMGELKITHAYHLVPRGASKAGAVEAHMRARGYAREECIAIGDSIEDLAVADVVGQFFVPANGPERDAGLIGAIGERDNVTVTEGAQGECFYEAVVGTLARR